MDHVKKWQTLVSLYLLGYKKILYFGPLSKFGRNAESREFSNLRCLLSVKIKRTGMLRPILNKGLTAIGQNQYEISPCMSIQSLQDQI